MQNIVRVLIENNYGFILFFILYAMNFKNIQELTLLTVAILKSLIFWLF
jgi:hypothetical protein